MMVASATLKSEQSAVKNSEADDVAIATSIYRRHALDAQAT